MSERAAPLHLMSEGDAEQFLVGRPSPEQLCSRTLAELRLIAGYLQVPGVSNMTKQECEERILRCWSGDKAGGYSGKGVMELETHRGVVSAAEA